MRANLIQTNFTSGEVSPRMFGRVDTAKYANGAAMLRNFIVLPQGGITRRPGTQYVNTAVANTYTRLISFTSSTSAAYVLEFGNQYVRFYINGGVVVDSATGSPIQLTTPYLPVDLDQLYVTQSADVMFITHPAYQTQVLTRQANSSWTIGPYIPEDGPYLSVDTTGNKCQLTTVSDTCTMVAYGVVSGGNGVVTTPNTYLNATGAVLTNTMVGKILWQGTNPGIAGATKNTLYIITSYVNANSLIVGTLPTAGVGYTFQVWGLTYLKPTNGYVFTSNDIGKYFNNGSAWLQVTAIINSSLVTISTPAKTLVALPTPMTQYSISATGGGSTGGAAANFTSGSVGQYLEYIVDGTWCLSKITAYVNSYTVKVTPLPNIFPDSLIYDIAFTLYTAGISTTATSSFTGVFQPSDIGKFVRATNKQAWGVITGFTNQSTVAITVLTVFSYVYPNLTMVLQDDRVITCGLAFTAQNTLQPSDVGRLIRLQFGAQFRAFTITSWTNSSTAVGTLNDYVPYDLINAANNYANGWADTFAMGAWSTTTGFPAICAFFDERLIFANTYIQPSTIWGSVSADYYNMAPTHEDGTVTDDSALNLTLVTGDANPITWMRSTQVLLVGTYSQEFQVTSPTGILSPTSIQATSQSSFGSLLPTVAYRFGVATVFLQRGGNKLREMLYMFQYNAFNCKDISIISEHILRTRSGAKSMAVQINPVPVLWIVCNNGDLVSVTYDRDQDVVAFAPHTIAGGQAQSVAVIPNNATDNDDVYVLVNRTPPSGDVLPTNWPLTSGPVYYTHTMTVSVTPGVLYTYYPSAYNVQLDNESSEFVYDTATSTLLGVGTPGNNSTIFSFIAIGSQVTITAFFGDTFTPVPTTNQLIGASANINTIELIQPLFDVQQGDTLTTMRFLDCCASYSGATTVTNVSGLSYLNGQTVWAIADGKLQGPFVVAGGAITLTTAAYSVCVGLPYSSIIGSLSPEGGSPTGTSQGKRKTIKQMAVRVKDSLPFQHGASLNQLIQIDAQNFVEDVNALGTVGQLVSGDVRFSPDVSWDTQAAYFLVQSNPYPLTIESVMPVININE